MDDENNKAETPIESSEQPINRVPGGEQQTIPEDPEVTKG